MGKKYLDENGLAYFWSKLKQYLATTSRAGLMSPTDKAKVDAITNQGTVSYHKKYEGTFTTTGSSTSTIPIPISSYSTADILLVDINGLDLVENTDYTISGTDIVLTNPIMESGQIVHFVAVRATTASVSDYALLKGDAGVVDAYPISGATPLSASWLSDTSGGSALTPEANQIYILMSDSGVYTANALFRWNGSAYVPLTSGGSVTSTSVPTANTISEFDSDAHMNSEDMTAQEVQDFVDNLESGGGGIDTGVITVYGDYCKCRRIGHIVQVWGESSNGWSITQGAYRAMATLGEGFRPPQNVRFVCGALGGTQQITGYVNTSGIVYLFTTSTTSYWNFSITYLVG